MEKVKNIEALSRAFAWGSIFACNLCFVYSIWVSRAFEYRVVHNYNHYGEGNLELLVFTLALPLVIREFWLTARCMKGEEK